MLLKDQPFGGWQALDLGKDAHLHLPPVDAVIAGDIVLTDGIFFNVRTRFRKKPDRKGDRNV